MRERKSDNNKFEDVEIIVGESLDSPGEFLRTEGNRRRRPHRRRRTIRQHRRGVMGVQRKEFTSRTTLFPK